MANTSPDTSIPKGRCGLCNGSDHRARLTFDDRRVLHCADCGIIFSDLIWDPGRVRKLYETPDFFAGEYWRWDGHAALDCLDAPAYEAALLTAKAVLGGTGRLLDVGCGLGGFLEQALVMGFASEGNDISEHTREVVERRLGISIHLGDLKSLALVAGRYDVVSSWDTLEHVLDPRALLVEMRRVVRPGGVLLLRTINEETLLTATANVLYRLGVRGPAARMHEPYHLYYFTRPLLSRLLSECRFAPLLRFNFEIHPSRLGLPAAARIAMSLMYRLQALLNREFMQLVIARAD